MASVAAPRIATRLVASIPKRPRTAIRTMIRMTHFRILATKFPRVSSRRGFACTRRRTMPLIAPATIQPTARRAIALIALNASGPNPPIVSMIGPIVQTPSLTRCSLIARHRRCQGAFHVPLARQSAFEDVFEDLHHFFRFPRDRQSGGIDFLEGVIVFRWLKDYERFAKRACIARVEGRVPLLVLVAEADDHNVGFRDSLAGADSVHHGPLVIVPVLVRLLPEDRDPAIVTCRVIRHRRGEPDIQSFGA